jgi:hypothetical protein
MSETPTQKVGVSFCLFVSIRHSTRVKHAINACPADLQALGNLGRADAFTVQPTNFDRLSTGCRCSPFVFPFGLGLRNAFPLAFKLGRGCSCPRRGGSGFSEASPLALHCDAASTRRKRAFPPPQNRLAYMIFSQFRSSTASEPTKYHAKKCGRRLCQRTRSYLSSLAWSETFPDLVHRKY